MPAEKAEISQNKEITGKYWRRILYFRVVWYCYLLLYFEFWGKVNLEIHHLSNGPGHRNGMWSHLHTPLSLDIYILFINEMGGKSLKTSVVKLLLMCGDCNSNKKIDLIQFHIYFYIQKISNSI